MIQRIVQLVFVILFLWIAIYPVDILALSNSVLLQPGPEENHIVYTTTGEISAI